MKRYTVTGVALYVGLWIVIATAYVFAWMFDYERESL